VLSFDETKGNAEQKQPSNSHLEGELALLLKNCSPPNCNMSYSKVYCSQFMVNFLALCCLLQVYFLVFFCFLLFSTTSVRGDRQRWPISIYVASWQQTPTEHYLICYRLITRKLRDIYCCLLHC